MCKFERNGKSKILLLPIILIIIILMSSFSGCIKTKNSANPPEMSNYFNYDDNGRLTGYVDAEGNNIRYVYDKKGQIVETVYPDRKVNYSYDALGNLVTITDGEGLVEFQYDAYNRLTKAKYKHSPDRSIEFDYDPWDRIEKMRIIDNNNQIVNSLGYQYDMFSRLKSIETSKGLIEYSYYPVENKMIRQYPNGIKSTFIYSSQMLPASLRHEDKLGNLLAEYKYDYDASGHVIRALENFPDIEIQETKYDWDNRGYLIGWTKPDGMKISYEYDMMGNRIIKKDSSGSVKYDYDDFGRLLQAGDLKYEWDKTGKLIKQMEGERVTKIEYNDLDLPSVIKTPDATIRYDWDAAGNMISKQQDNKITYILPDPLSLPGSALAEFDEVGHISNSYIYGNGLLAQQDASGDMRYFLEDGFNSIRYVTNMNGKILGQRDYSPFGESYAVKGDNVGDFHSSGVRVLPEIQGYFVGNNLYDVSSGQYLSPSPGYFVKKIVKWGILEETKLFSMYVFQRIGANYARQQWGPLFEEVYGKKGAMFGKGLARSLTFLFYWAELWEKEEKRKLLGIPKYSPEFVGDWAKGTLKLVIKGLIWFYADAYQLGLMKSGVITLSGDFLTDKLIEGAEGFGTFYGTRMDRPYWWWSPMKWIPMEDYLRIKYSNQLERRQTIDTAQDAVEKYYLNYNTRNKLFPPFWDDGDGGGGSASVNPLPQTPFSNEKELGGIELSAKARFIGDLGRITAAVYDNETGNIVLVGDGNVSLPSLNQEDIQVAIELALTGANAQFSLDPADPKNPKGEWIKALYIPEDILKGTRFGNELFEADWLLKQYSFGVKVDESGETSERITKVKDFKDIFDLSFENFEAQKKEQWNRFWIVNDKATLKKTDNAVYFDTINMEVKTEEMHFTGKKLKGKGREDPEALKFAEFFSTHYDEFAEESPPFDRVKEMAKAVAMANWLVDLGVPINMSWYSNKPLEDKFEKEMLALSNRPNFKISETENGKKFVDQVHSLSEDQEKSTRREYEKNGKIITETSTRTMNLFGGVDLKVNPDYIADDGQAKRIREEVREAITENPGQIKFDLQDNGQKFKGMILPITQSGISLWEDLDSGISNAEFIRNDEGKIQSFKLELDGSWTANAERTKDGGSEISLKTPNEHRFQYQYNPEGYLYQLNVDNDKVAEYQYDSKTRILSVGYNRFKEYMTYDDGGRVQSYKRVGQQLSESVQFNYDQEGRLKGIDYGELGRINFEYKGDLLASAITPWSEFNYTYDSGNRITAISESGNTVNFQYDGNLLKKAAADFQGQTSEIIFEDGLLKEIRGFAGENMKYEYNQEGLLKSATDSQGAKAVYYYDDRLRLNRIELPSGSSEEYVYGIVGKKGDTKERLIKKIVHPINS